MTEEFHLPDLGEGIYEAELVAWHVQAGEEVAHGQTLMEVMTDKAVMEVPAPFTGGVEELLVKPGDQIKVGRAVLRYAEADEKESETKAVEGETSTTSETPSLVRDGLAATAPSRSAQTRVPASPSVRRRARELGVELTAVKGTGPGGRVLAADLEAHAQQRSSAGNGRGCGRAAPPPTPELELTPGSRIKLRGLRRAIAQRMSLAKRTIPHFSLIDECDATALVALRESLKSSCEQASVKLTYLAFMVRAVVAALKETPLVNASLDEAAEEIVLRDHWHIGVATATPEGLIVPVIHDADRKDILEIAREIQRLAGAVRNGQARPEDLRGGTFTITSIGNIGGLISTPIIPPGQVGIMGVGKLVRRPVYDEHGQIRPADLMYLSFSFDHRVVDGDVGAQFAQAVIGRLENPATLLLPV